MVKLYLFRKNLERNETLLEDRVTLLQNYLDTNRSDGKNLETIRSKLFS